MPDDREKSSRLEKILFSIRARDAGASSGGDWQAGLMREIRSMGPLGGEATFLEGLGALAWRFSLAGGIGIALLVIYTLRVGLVPYQDLTLAMLDDPISILLSGLM
jgi:hypothetical protein